MFKKIYIIMQAICKAFHYCTFGAFSEQKNVRPDLPHPFSLKKISQKNNMCLSHIYVRRKKRVAKRHEKERAAKKARADMHFSRRHKCNATTRVLTNVKPFPLSDVIVSYSLYRSARGVTDFCRPVKH